MARTYKALGIPETQIFALDEAVPNGKNPHVQGVHDQIYKPIWTKMLGNNPRSGHVDDLAENQDDHVSQEVDEGKSRHVACKPGAQRPVQRDAELYGCAMPRHYTHLVRRWYRATRHDSIASST